MSGSVGLGYTCTKLTPGEVFRLRSLGAFYLTSVAANVFDKSSPKVNTMSMLRMWVAEPR